MKIKEAISHLPSAISHQLLAFSFFVLPFLAISQPQGGGGKDRIETMHIAYLSQKLNLTSDEAQKFWPLYNEYRASIDKLGQQRRDNARTVKDAGGIDNMKSEDVQKLIAGETDIETRELELRKEYVLKFQQVLPVQKVAKLFISEDQFKRFLLKQLEKRRDERGGGPRDNRGSGDDDLGGN